MIYPRTVSFSTAWRRGLVALTVLVFAGVAVGRIISTYSIFSQTWDEGPHLAAGMEWLNKGTYTYEAEAPPLARVAVALGPFLAGLRHTGHNDMWQEGNEILHADGRYSHNLTLARVGVLPFFLLAIYIVWLWSRIVFGTATALLAILLFTTLPPALAHAGLATTDMALTATFLAALLVFIYWLDRPSILRSVLLGVAGAFAALSKFSALVFLPSCGLAVVGLRWAATGRVTEQADTRGRHWLTAMGFTMLTAALIIWGGYWFSHRPLTTAVERPHETIDNFVGREGVLHDLAYTISETIPIPGPEFFLGVNQVRHHNEIGHKSYLLGEIRSDGWWYFFPVAVAVRSPLPFLVFSGVGFILLGQQMFRHRAWRPLVPAIAATTLLLVCLPSRINIGLRHVLPIYPLLAIVAGFGVANLWSLARPRLVGPATVIALLTWQFASSAYSHPDYLTYFNELAGRHPERILVNGDLDWGQDLLRLADTLRARGVDAVAIAYNGGADLSRHNLPRIRQLVPHQPTTGWIAISEMPLKMGGLGLPNDAFSWLEAYEPVALVGRSIRLYYVPESEVADARKEQTRWRKEYRTMRPLEGIR